MRMAYSKKHMPQEVGKKRQNKPVAMIHGENH